MATIALTFVLVAVTIVYARSTYRIQKANEAIVALTKQQLEDTLRPYVSVGVFLIPSSSVFRLRIANTGRTAARGLNLSIDRPFCQFADPKRDLRGLRAFQEPVESFHPGAELLFLLTTDVILFGLGADTRLTPSTFSITASYDIGSSRVTETTAVDLRPYLNSTLPADPLVSELHQCRTALEGIRAEIQEATRARA